MMENQRIRDRDLEDIEAGRVPYSLRMTKEKEEEKLLRLEARRLAKGSTQAEKELKELEN